MKGKGHTTEENIRIRNETDTGGIIPPIIIPQLGP